MNTAHPIPTNNHLLLRLHHFASLLNTGSAVYQSQSAIIYIKLKWIIIHPRLTSNIDVIMPILNRLASRCSIGPPPFCLEISTHPQCTLHPVAGGNGLSVIFWRWYCSFYFILFTFRRSIQDSKIQVDMDMVIYK